MFQLPGLADPASGFEGGRRFATDMLASGLPFTAVLAFDDLTALGVVRGLTEAGMSIPDDCSVMGFDDVLPAAVATPAMTTIRQPLRRWAAIGTAWMLRAIKKARASREGPQLHQAAPELGDPHVHARALPAYAPHRIALRNFVTREDFLDQTVQ